MPIKIETIDDVRDRAAYAEARALQLADQVHDLLDALKLALRALNGGADSLTATEHKHAFHLARAAIARAEGQS